MYEWVREHFFEVLAGAAGLVVLLWLYRRAGSRIAKTKSKGRSYCRHCNWEGRPNPRSPKCRRCGSGDLRPVTH